MAPRRPTKPKKPTTPTKSIKPTKPMKPTKPVTARRGRHISRTAAVAAPRKPTQGRQIGKKRRRSTQNTGASSNPPRKNIRRHVSQPTKKAPPPPPNRAPTPPKERSRNYRPYGGLTPVFVEVEEKSVSDAESDVEDDSVSTDDEEELMSGVESGTEDEEEGEQLNSRHVPSTGNPRVCQRCGRRHPPKPILKRRKGPYPNPRQGGKRSKRKIRFSSRVKVFVIKK